MATNQVTIYDLGYSRSITKEDDFYMENAQTVSKVTGGVAASNLLGGETSGNMTMLDGFYRSDNYVYGSAGWSLESDNAYFWNVTISGTLVSSNIHIPDENTTANSFHTDINGNSWWGCTHANFTANNNNATAYILKTGAARFSSLTVVGGSIDGTSTIGGRLASVLNTAIDASGHFADAAFNTATNNILGAFTFGASGAIQIGTYSAGVTGDIRISPTGILARDKNNATTFSLDATTGVGVLAGLVVGTNVGLGTAQTASQVTTIIGNTVTTSFVNALNITAVSMSVGGLTSGTITSKTVTLAVAAGTGDSYIAAGKTDFTNVGTAGFILGLDDSDSDKAKFYIGDSTHYLNWNGTSLSVLGGSIIGGIIKTSDVTYPDVLINTSGLTLHGEKLILKEEDGTASGTIGSTPTYGIRMLAESGKSIQLTTGNDFAIGAPTGGNFFSYDEGTTNLSISPPGVLTLDGSTIIVTSDIKPNSDGGISIGDADQQIENIYIRNQLRFSAMSSLPVSGNVAGDIGTFVVAGVTKLVIFDGTSWVPVGSQT
jgi:hypothetical protein